MSRRIEKIPFRKSGFQQLVIPYSWKPIHVGLDDKGQPSMWCEVATAAVRGGIKVWLLKDECDIPEDAEHYVGSFRLGVHICHIYTEQWAI